MDCGVPGFDVSIEATYEWVTHTHASMYRWPISKMGFLSLIPPSPRPAPLPSDAVVKEFAKIPLSGLEYILLNSSPEPERAWAPPSKHVTLPKHSLMNRTSFMARPLCVFLAA